MKKTADAYPPLKKKMKEAKEKDRILAQINSFTPHSEIVGLEKHISSLKADNLLDVWYNEQQQPISIRLSDKGKDFIKNGGYTAQRNRMIKAVAWKGVRWLLAALILAAIGAIVNTMLPRWLST